MYTVTDEMFNAFLGRCIYCGLVPYGCGCMDYRGTDHKFVFRLIMGSCASCPSGVRTPCV